MTQHSSKKNVDLPLWKRIIFGFPTEFYFFLRWIYLMLTVSKDFLSNPVSPAVPPKKAVVFIYGLFGNSYQFADLKQRALQEDASIACYFFDYPHGQTLESDANLLVTFLKTLPPSLEEIYLVGHSRGGILAYKAQVNLAADKRYFVMTLASPFHGADLANFFNYILQQKSLLWYPIQSLIYLLIWLTGTQNILNDFSQDNFPPPQGEGLQLYHLIAKYDSISGSPEKQRLNDDSPHIYINGSHAGVIYTHRTQDEFAKVIDNQSSKSTP